MITIHLNNLVFFAFHGVYDEERILGNDYEVNVALDIDTVERITMIEETVNYQALYKIIQQRMNIATLLLETVAQDLVDEIHRADKRIKNIIVTIQKKYPPLAAFEGSVGVTCKKEF